MILSEKQIKGAKEKYMFNVCYNLTSPPNKIMH